MALQLCNETKLPVKFCRHLVLPVEADHTYLHYVTYIVFFFFFLHLSPSSGNCCVSEGFVSHGPADKDRVFSLSLATL